MRRGWMCLAFLAGCGTVSPGSPYSDQSGDTDPPEADGPLVVADLAWDHSDVPYLGPITVTWTQTTEGWGYVEYQVAEEWRRTPDIHGGNGDNAATVVGIPLDSSAAWRITAVDEGTSVDGDDALKTPPAPDGLQVGEV